jgi:hypothetical protein
MVFASEAVRASKPAWFRKNAASRAYFALHQLRAEDRGGDRAVFSVPKNRYPT